MEQLGAFETPIKMEIALGILNALLSGAIFFIITDLKDRITRLEDHEWSGKERREA